MHIEEFQRYNSTRLFGRLLFAFIGFLFGCGLWCNRVFTCFDPDPLFIPSVIFSSPLGVFEGVFGDGFWDVFEVALFYGSPILWTIIGVLSYEMLTSGSKHRPFLVVMGLHFGCMPLLLSIGMYGDWEFFWRVYRGFTVEISAFFAFYGLAQALAWNCFVVGCYKRRSQFSIRTLLVVTLLFAIWLSCMAMVVRGPQAKTDANQHTKANIAEE